MPKLTKKILMIIASVEFRDEEYKEPRDVFEKAGMSVEVASDVKKECTGKLGMKVIPDKALKEVKVRDYDAVVFVGGRGSKNYWNDQTCHRIAKEALSLGKIVSAICSAPVILANAGLLTGKKATCFSGDSAELKAKEVLYTGEGVETDGRIVTADGPASAGKFGKSIVALLIGLRTPGVCKGIV